MLTALALTAVTHLGILADSLAIVGSPPIVPVLPLSIAVASSGGKPVRDAAWVDERIAESQRVYNAFGIYFRKAEVRSLDERLAKLETRADRDSLAASLRKGYINVFVVDTLRDVDDTEHFIMGVHWAPKGDLARHFVILASRASKTTLAHEIGHFFGLPHHHVPDNLMSYVRTGADVFLNPQQKKTAATNAKVAVARKQFHFGP